MQKTDAETVEGITGMIDTTTIGKNHRVCSHGLCEKKKTGKGSTAGADSRSKLNHSQPANTIAIERTRGKEFTRIVEATTSTANAREF